MKPLLTALAVTSMFMAAPIFAAGTAADDISVSDAYVRLAPPGQAVTGAFMTFKNAGDKDHKVVKADNTASKVTELHTHTNEGGMMKMRQVKDIEIKAKGETALKPGGLHIMLIDLKQTLKEGENVAMTITFEDGSSKKLEAPIKKPQDMMPMMDHKH